MIRTALRSTTLLASISFARPVFARGIVLPVLIQAQAESKRGYHEKVIDHYENPRNVRIMSLASSVNCFVDVPGIWRVDVGRSLTELRSGT